VCPRSLTASPGAAAGAHLGLKAGNSAKWPYAASSRSSGAGAASAWGPAGRPPGPHSGTTRRLMALREMSARGQPSQSAKGEAGRWPIRSGARAQHDRAVILHAVSRSPAACVHRSAPRPGKSLRRARDRSLMISGSEYTEKSTTASCPPSAVRRSKAARRAPAHRDCLRHLHRRAAWRRASNLSAHR
jgi:hypothetical protein